MATGKEGDNGSRRDSVNFRVLDEAWHRLGDRPPVGVHVGARAGDVQERVASASSSFRAKVDGIPQRCSALDELETQNDPLTGIQGRVTRVALRGIVSSVGVMMVFLLLGIPLA
ncbi:hypothetical protein L3X38_041554 [Prunus dulcis]|uniref:Uncharacterized protein n=1 Tax=Prunus dulcis TaxID=3755 RepID=A0AAD4YKD0_PRUDU|nr:hypothetical protein L3X38_041554 [Prunus dulcis]